MLTVEQALAEVLARVRPLPAIPTTLETALGRTLAEDIASDLDSPPHDKSMVDGYAIRAADLQSGVSQWTVVEEVLAGQVPQHTVRPGSTTRIMTGAPIPDGADAVVMIEQSTMIADADPPRVTLNPAKTTAGQNIMRRGQSMTAGTVVLRRGTPLRAIEVGLLAEVGRTQFAAIARPRAAVVSTGDELVPPSHTPDRGQIRNSNGPMLAALVRQAGGEPVELGIARDNAAALKQAIRQGLECDVLVLSGGVSAGVADLVPQLLAEAGVRQIFHKVQLRPGKPLWFGVAEQSAASGPDRLVYGLPGNPVSSLVCFELFVRPAMQGLAGRAATGLTTCHGALATAYQHRGERPTFHPARVTGAAYSVDGQRPTLELLPWQGSADLATLAAANALASFPAGNRQFAAGETVPFVWL